MTFDEIKQRIAKLENDAQQAAGAFNSAMGAWNEAKAILKFMEDKASEVVADVKQVIDGQVEAPAETAAPVVPEPTPAQAAE